MNCIQCGAAIPAGAKFCGRCGAAAPPEASGAAPEAQPEAAAPAGAPSGQAAPPPPAPSTPPSAPAQPAYAAAPRRDWIGDGVRYLLRIVKFDLSVYADLRGDAGFTFITPLAAVLAIFIFAFGGWLWTVIDLAKFVNEGKLFWQSVLVGVLLAVVLWLVWVAGAFALLLYVFKREVRFEEVLRVLGAASIPLAAGFFMFIPEISFAIAVLATAIWVLTSVLALQAAFDLQAREAVASSLAGFSIWAVVLTLIVTDNNTFGPGIMIYEAVADIFSGRG